MRRPDPFYMAEQGNYQAELALGREVWQDPEVKSQPVYEMLKRLIDIFAALFMLLLLSPIMIIVAVLIYIASPGPALYKATRVGKKGKLFKQLKFRSMIMNAPDLRNADGSTRSDEDDPRLTKIGKFIRKTSLDELPQFINVLLGTMSLVGPRPDPPNVLPLYRPQDFRRQLASPGITGWAIVHGRNSIPWEKRRDYDIEYVEKRSLMLDMQILFRTVGLVLRRKGIHAKREEK